MKKLNIIQFMPYFPPHKWWVETVWEEIWKYWLKKWYWEFINVIFDVWQNSFIKTFNKENLIYQNNNLIWYKKNWYTVFLLPSFDLISNFPFPKFWDKKFWIIMKIIKQLYQSNSLLWEEGGQEQKYVIITHTRFFISSLIWWIFARKNKIKWIHIEHWSDFVKLSSELKSKISYFYDIIIWKWIFKKSDKILAISEASKIFINKNFIKKQVDVFYRWIDLINLDKIKNKQIRLVFIWRLVTLKWVDLLIRAFTKIHQNISLDIIWDWEESHYLKQLVTELEIKDKVNFIWYQDKNFINNYLSSNKVILVNPSYQEGMPTTVIESLFYKNLVIASNVWWTKEISNLEDLILFKVWNISDLQEKINFAIENYDNFAWKSKLLIDNKFNRENNIEKLYNLIS